MEHIFIGGTYRKKETQLSLFEREILNSVLAIVCVTAFKNFREKPALLTNPGGRGIDHLRSIEQIYLKSRKGIQSYFVSNKTT